MVWGWAWSVGQTLCRSPATPNGRCRMHGPAASPTGQSSDDVPVRPGLNEPATPAVTTLRPFIVQMAGVPLSFCHRMSDR